MGGSPADNTDFYAPTPATMVTAATTIEIHFMARSFRSLNFALDEFMKAG